MQIKNKETIDKVAGIIEYTLLCRGCQYTEIVKDIRRNELNLLATPCPKCATSDKAKEKEAIVQAEVDIAEAKAALKEAKGKEVKTKKKSKRKTK